MCKISIVSTLYRSARTIPEFVRRVEASVQKITDSYQIILVNDGSPDESLQIARGLMERHPALEILNLSRNFGHHKAMMTGIRHADGDYTLVIDSDLEEPPECLETFWKEIEHSEYDVVYGVQQSRKGGIFERLSGQAFYYLFNVLSQYRIPENLLMARLMTRRYREELCRFGEKELFLASIFQMVGYRQKEVEIVKQSIGGSTYTLRRKLALMLNAVTATSEKPLVYLFYLGLVMMMLSGIFLVKTLLWKMLFNVSPGYSSITASIWFLGSTMIFSLGVIGIYLSKIFIEIKVRPYTIVADHYRASSAIADTSFGQG